MRIYITFFLAGWSLLMVILGLIPFFQTFGDIQTSQLILQLINLRLLAMAVIWMALFGMWMFAERYKE